MSSTSSDGETKPPSSRTTSSFGFEIDYDATQERKLEHCLLSDTIERLVLSDHDHADYRKATAPELKTLEGHDIDDDSERMADALRRRGFFVQHPRIKEQSEKENEHGREIEASGDLDDAIRRFKLLLCIMQRRQSPLGLTEAHELESLLLTIDPDAFEREGCSTLREYLMLARQAGIPLKFSGEASATIQDVWFKGRRDLQHAIGRYTDLGNSQSLAPKEKAFDPHFLIRVVERHIDQDPNQDCRSTKNCVSLSYLEVPPKGSASAFLVEKSILEECQQLYTTLPEVRNFQHYLMHMRMKGAAIKYCKDQCNIPTWIFLQIPTPGERGISHTDTGTELRTWRSSFLAKEQDSPFSRLQQHQQPQQIWKQPHQEHRTSSGGTFYEGEKEEEEEGGHSRFVHLIQAIKANAEGPLRLAKPGKIRQTLERLDEGIFARERCTGLKQLLKIARVHGIDVYWQQVDGVITEVALNEHSSPAFRPTTSPSPSQFSLSWRQRGSPLD